MTCPVCGGRVIVRDTRVVGQTVIRWRECLGCHRDYFTKEAEMDYAEGRALKNRVIKSMRGKK